MNGLFGFMMNGQGGYVLAAFVLSFVLIAAEVFRLRKRLRRALRADEEHG